MAVEHTMEQGYTAKLDLRLGNLRFSNGSFNFSPVLTKVTAPNDRQSIATSCNSEYRKNKRYLTTLRQRPNDDLHEQETVYSTVRDALSSIPTQKTKRRSSFFGANDT